MRFFNTAGPINPKNHYYVPHRLDEKAVMQMINQQKYFILHAPRQSGKTTAIKALVKELNNSNHYAALYINIEAAQVARSNVEQGIFTILDVIRLELKSHFPNANFSFFNSAISTNIASNGLRSCLHSITQELNKPFIIFIDEIDSLIGDTLISVLRQLRSGYNDRPEGFPQSLCLIGVRDVRDYRIWSDQGNNMVLGGSAFNIKAQSLVLNNFSLEQLRDLYDQHTQETGQQFTDEAMKYAFTLTQGQPWLVNALAYQACFDDVTDRTIAITKEVIERAKEVLILRRDTHIDVLVDRLQEPRVRTIIDAILSGNTIPENFPIDDVTYLIDLGLVARHGQALSIANPIYQEIIPRELSYGTQLSITQDIVWYKNENNSLNVHKLLESFTQFYRQNSDIWLEKFNYKESGPHILLMAFLQRIINGGGKIHREYALGRGRVDLFIEYQSQRIIIELKIKRGERTTAEGLEQTAQYMDLNNATEGHLIIFDRDAKKSWDEKIYQQKEIMNNKSITIWGL